MAHSLDSQQEGHRTMTQQGITKAMIPLRLWVFSKWPKEADDYLWVILEAAPVSSHGGGGYVRAKPRGSSSQSAAPGQDLNEVLAA